MDVMSDQTYREVDAQAIGQDADQSILIPVCLRHIDPGKKEKAFFLFGGDPRKCDSSLQVRIVYERNDKVHECLENRLLDTCVSTRDKLNRIANEVRDFVQSLNSFYMPATGINIVTEDCNQLTFKTFIDTGVFAGLVLFPEIPHSLSPIPTALINDLTKLKGISYDVDLVSWSGAHYAFKKTVDADTMLSEVSALWKLRDYAAINPPTALVVDGSMPKKIRGFLSRYMPGGDLGALLEGREEMRETGAPFPVIPWSTKIAWVQTLARTLLAMRTAGICNGDLNPDNVLLDGHGGVRLVDFGPVGPTVGWGAPEYVNAWDAFHARACGAGGGKVESKVDDFVEENGGSGSDAAGFDFAGRLTPAMDIYGLGAIMWALGEEKAAEVDERTWALSPPWYRDIAESCLSDDPARRPSAANVLFRLVAMRLVLFIAR